MSRGLDENQGTWVAGRLPSRAPTLKLWISHAVEAVFREHMGEIGRVSNFQAIVA